MSEEKAEAIHSTHEGADAHVNNSNSQDAADVNASFGDPHADAASSKDAAVIDSDRKKSRVKKPPPPLIRPDGKHIKKRKKYEDPMKPKKENREKALAEFSGAGLLEVTKILGARWLALPEAKKQEYVNRHEANRHIYEAQLAEYEREHKYPCGVCSAEVGDGEEAVMCEQSCERWFHRDCSKLSADAFALIAEEPQAVWMCDSCYAEAIIMKAKPEGVADTRTQ